MSAKDKIFYMDCRKKEEKEKAGRRRFIKKGVMSTVGISRA